MFVVAKVLYAVVPSVRGGRYGPRYGGQTLPQYHTRVVPLKPVDRAAGSRYFNASIIHHSR